MKKNEVKKEEETPVLKDVVVISELDQLVVLHKEMKDRGFNSI